MKTDNKNNGRFYSIQDTAIQLNISIATLFRIVQKGKISNYKVGKRIWFNDQSIIDYLNSNKGEANGQ